MNGGSGAEEKSSSYSSAHAHELEMPAFKGSRRLRLRWFLSYRYYLNSPPLGCRLFPRQLSYYIFVHGGWCGGWLWRYVAPALRERGHVVTTPTLTGLGERRHSENRTATLSTHIEDIVAHIEMEDFQDVTLVSQSYGGMVATGTLARIPNRIRSTIYLDAFVPEDGKSLVDCFSPEHKLNL
jgi:pimeloyl-ACP methyl ester carboxylesterase